jgi:ribose/xylose/arabinose/galactoside ABC-type transport system permease subunit
MRGGREVTDQLHVSNNKKNIGKTNMMSQMIRFMILLLAILLLFTFLIPSFNYIKVSNLNNILTDAVIPAIFGFAMGIIIAGSGFDLSLGHIASMVASIVAYLMSRGLDMHPVMAIIIGLTVAALVGSISGFIVSRMGISSFIVTLGMQFLVIGARQLITRGQSVYINNEGFKWLARRPLGLSNLVFILIIVAVLCFLLMEKSAFGRKIHFVGANIEASRFSGIDVRKITFSIFVLGAVLAAFGGILFAARAGAVQINSVDFRLLDAITIAVFSSVLFGRFRTIGIILVAILISMIATGLSMLGIQTEWIEFVKGFILLSSIVMSKFNHEDKMIKKILVNHQTIQKEI